MKVEDNDQEGKKRWENKGKQYTHTRSGEDDTGEKKDAQMETTTREVNGLENEYVGEGG